jgi:hypothetical protein
VVLRAARITTQCQILQGCAVPNISHESRQSMRYHEAPQMEGRKELRLRKRCHWKEIVKDCLPTCMHMRFQTQTKKSAGRPCPDRREWRAGKQRLPWRTQLQGLPTCTGFPASPCLLSPLLHYHGMSAGPSIHDTRRSLKHWHNWRGALHATTSVLLYFDRIDRDVLGQAGQAIRSSA